MINLVGFAVSNYYNKVKIALLEKGVEFTEELNWAAKDEATLARSPLGKVPFIDTPQGPLSESQVIVDYLEQAFPAHPLIPADPYAAAKTRELVTYIELYLELVARRLYKEAFFGGDTFTIADCSALVCLPTVGMATKAIYGEDLLAGLPVREYLKTMGARPSMVRVNADRKANQELRASMK